MKLTESGQERNTRPFSSSRVSPAPLLLIVFILFLLVVPTASAYTKPKNYCEDENMNVSINEGQYGDMMSKIDNLFNLGRMSTQEWWTNTYMPKEDELNTLRMDKVKLQSENKILESQVAMFNVTTRQAIQLERERTYFYKEQAEEMQTVAYGAVFALLVVFVAGSSDRIAEFIGNNMPGFGGGG